MALLLAIALIRYNLARLYAIFLPDVVSIKSVLAAGGLGAFTAIVPKRARLRVLAQLRAVLRWRFALRVALLLVGLALLPFALSTAVIRWTGPAQVALQINGRTVQLQSERTFGTAHTFRLIGLITHRIQISSGGYDGAVRLLPFRQESVTLPFYATSDQNPRLAGLEFRILATFFTLFDRKELSDIQKTFLEVKNSKTLDPLAVERLQRIRDIVDNNANTSATIETKANLVENFADDYPGDPGCRY